MLSLSLSLSLSLLFLTSTAVVVIVEAIMTARRCCSISPFYIHLRFGPDTCILRERKYGIVRKNKRKEAKRWNCTMTGTNLFCCLPFANTYILVFRIFAFLSLSLFCSVTKDKCLFCTSKLSKRGRRKIHLIRLAEY